MDLDKLQINASIRSGWQALDLGFLMARAWWRPLFVASLVPMLPLTLVLSIALAEHPFYLLFVIWWLLPFWERLPLYIASRLLFGQTPGVLANMRSIPLKDVLPWLLWRRLSPQRAFDNPVTVLEELKGSQRRARLRVLHGKYSDVALANQIVCWCFELILGFGLVMLLVFFIPDQLGLRLQDSYDNLTLAGAWVYTIAGLISMVLILPFHTMAGFALYLNRRIELEAWDIEISFRNLAQRKRQGNSTSGGMLVACLVVGLLICGMPIAADAEITDHDRESATQLINEILSGTDFGEEKIIRKWRLKDWNEDTDEAESMPEWVIDFVEWWEDNVGWSTDFGNFATWLKYLLIVAAVALILYLFYRFRAPLARITRGEQKQAAPEILFGLDVTPESLPTDVPAEVMQLWTLGSYREALSLLYRASLSRLIDKHALEFRASHTEAECAALVKAQGIQSLSDYFWQLTTIWRRLAYGHQLPACETVQGLCQDWSRELADAPE